MMGLNKTRHRNKEGGSGLFPISIQSMRDSNVKVFILMKIQAEKLYCKGANITTSQLEAPSFFVRFVCVLSYFVYMQPISNYL